MRREQLDLGHRFGWQGRNIANPAYRLAVDQHHRLIAIKVRTDIVEQLAHGVAPISGDLTLAELILIQDAFKRAIVAQAEDHDLACIRRPLVLSNLIGVRLALGGRGC